MTINDDIIGDDNGYDRRMEKIADEVRVREERQREQALKERLQKKQEFLKYLRPKDSNPVDDRPTHVGGE